MQVTIYVPAADKPLLKTAKRIAKERRESLSHAFGDLIRRYVEEYSASTGKAK